MSAEVAFTKGNLDDYLRMLAKEFRKRNGKVMPGYNPWNHIGDCLHDTE